MGARAEAKAWLTLNGTQFRNELKRAERDLQEFRSGVETHTKAAAVAAGAAAAAMGAVGYRLDARMSDVRAALGATTAEMRALEAQARQVGPAMASNAEQAAAAQLALAKAGNDVRNTMLLLPASMALASAAQVEQAQSADLLDGVLGRYQIAATDSMRVTNELFLAQSRSGAGFEGLAAGLQAAAPAVSAYRVSLEDTLAAMAVLAEAELTGEQGGTAYKQALLALTDAQRDHKGVLGEVLQAWDVSSEGIVGAVRRMEDAGVSVNTIISELGNKAGPGLAVMLRQGSAAMQGWKSNLQGTTAAQDAVAAKAGELPGMFNTFTNQLREVAYTFWGAMRGPVAEAMREITGAISAHKDEIAAAAGKAAEAIATIGGVIKDVTKWLGENKDALTSWVVVLGTAATALYLVATAQKVWNAAMAVNPIMALITLMAILVGLIVDMVREAGGVEQAWVQTVGTLQIALTEAVGFFRMLGETIVFQASKIPALVKGMIRGEDLALVWQDLQIGHAAVMNAIEYETKAKVFMIKGNVTEAVNALNAAKAAAAGSQAGQGGGAPAPPPIPPPQLPTVDVQGAMGSQSPLQSRQRSLGSNEDLKAQMSIVDLLPPEVVDAATEANRRLREDLDKNGEAVRNFQATLEESAMAGWGAMTREASKYYKFSNLLHFQGLRFFTQAIREGTAAYIEGKEKQASIDAAKNLADAAMALSRWDIVAAGHAMVSFGLNAGIARGAALGASLVRGGGGAGAPAMQMPDQPPAGGDNGDGGRNSSGRQTVDVSTGNAPDVVNIYMSTTVNGPVVSDDGMDTLVDRWILPRVKELIEGNAWGARAGA